MSIVTCHTLNSAQKAQIHSLEKRCQNESPLTLSFPTDGFEFCLLYFDGNGTLCSAAAFTSVGETVFECSAFTDPVFRRQGLFSMLLEEGIKRLPEETDLLFYSDGACPDTAETLKALEAGYLACDHMMELSLEAFKAAGRAWIPGGPHSALNSFVSVEESVDEEGLPLLLFRSEYGEALVSCQKACCYLYSFEIREPFRGLGHGKNLLCLILKTLFERSPMPVRLQVSGDNLPALSLYKKTGFRITDTLSTYLY